MNLCIRFYLFQAIAVLLLSINSNAQTVITPARGRQVVAEEILVRYGGLPRLEGDGFYMLFLFGAGGSFHDSKNVDQLPEGTIRFNAVGKAGNYNLILFAYKNVNDSKPKKVTSAGLEIVSAPTSVSKMQPIPAVQKSRAGTTAKSNPEFASPVVSNETYKLSTPRLNVNEVIPVSYNLPELPADSYYYISVSRREDSYAANSSNILTKFKGLATLKPIYQEGIFELRVYKSDKNTGVSSLAYRQPLAIGKIKKSFEGMYTCNLVEPSISGKRLAASPSVQQVKQLLIQSILKDKDAWIDEEDICIEIRQIQFMNSQSLMVPVAGSGKTVSALAFPILIQYKTTFNDHFNKKTVVKEPGISERFTFYKQAGIWQIMKSKS